MLHWQKVMALVQADFQEGRLAKDCTCQAVFLITNGGGYYHGIVLVELVRKVLAVIIDRCSTASISFHHVLCGFLASCGTCTTSIEAKLLQKLMAMR